MRCPGPLGGAAGFSPMPASVVSRDARDGRDSGCARVVSGVRRPPSASVSRTSRLPEIAERAGLRRDRRGRLARLRRPRGRRLGAPRPSGGVGLGRGRPRRDHDHVIGPRRPTGDPTGWLPGGPAVRTVLGVPPDHAVRAVGSIGGGDGLVEIWNGMPFLLAAVGPEPAGRLPASRPRRDVEDGPAPRTGRTGLRHRAPAGTARLPPQPDRHPVLVVQGGDRRAPAASRPSGSSVSPPGVEARLLPGRRALGGAAGGGGRPAGAGQALRAADRGAGPAEGRPSRPARPSSSARATSARPRGAGRRHAGPGLDLAARLRAPTTSWSICTGGPGWWRPPRCARGGG